MLTSIELSFEGLEIQKWKKKKKRKKEKKKKIAHFFVLFAGNSKILLRV